MVSNRFMAALTDTQINRLFGLTADHGAHVKSLYLAAIAADDAYSAAINATGAKDRWTMTTAQILSTRDAFHAKIAADKAFGDALAYYRNR